MNSKTMPEGITTVEILQLFRRYWSLITSITAIILTITVLVLAIAPKKFKSKFVLTIYTKYFQNPLVKDFVPEVNDGQELRAQRESLIREAMTPEFLDSLAKKHQLFPKSSGPSSDREDLLRRIDVFSVNTTSFQVAFIGSSPTQVQDVTRDLYTQVTQHLMKVKRDNLLKTRDSIRKRIESMAFSMGTTADPRASLRPKLLQEDINKVRGQIKALGEQYTNEHPAIMELREREAVILRWLKQAPSNGNSSNSGYIPMVGGEPAEATLDVYKDLIKKLNYLNIAIDTESSREPEYFTALEAPNLPSAPFSPQKTIFLFWALGISLLTSFFLISIREYFLRTALRAETVAQRFGVPYLGKIPSVRWSER